MNKTAIIIPSHLAAKRLPNKPLIKIKDKAMITHVWEKAIATKVKDVFVATADKEIADEIAKQGGNAVITGKHHTTGSDRIFEAIQKLKLDHDIIINVQGDMPTVNPKTINLINDFMITNQNIPVSTVASKIKKNEESEKNIVKAITAKHLSQNEFQKAIDFVRIIENEKFFYHHIGLYAYKTSILKDFVSLKKTENEINRSLEQLRFIDHGIDVFVGYTDDNPLSVDTQEDLENIKKII